MESFEYPVDPATLACIRAEQDTSLGFEVTDDDMRLLAELDHGAEQLGFHDQSYFVQTHRALAIPAAFEADQPLNYHDFMGLTLEGTFVSYAKLRIGRLLGVGAVRAICLAFKDALLLPGFDRLPETDILYVPVLAVSEISQTS